MGQAGLLGEFELYLLAALEHLGDHAYGVTIRQEIESRSGRNVPIGSVYVTLDRLAHKGFIRFEVSRPLPIPGGRSRKHAYLTASGRRALHHSIQSLDRMLAGIRGRLKPTPASPR